MARCAACGSRVVLGGARDGELRYCNGLCRKSGPLTLAKATVPEELLQAWARELHGGPCPECGGEGPVDVQDSYRIYSVIVFSHWQTVRLYACHRCGQQARWTSFGASLLAGWWGLPFGLVMTPVQLARNLIGLLSARPSPVPSRELLAEGRAQLGRERAAAMAAGALPASRS